MKFCQNCRQKLANHAVICPKCGASTSPQHPQATPPQYQQEPQKMYQQAPQTLYPQAPVKKKGLAWWQILLIVLGGLMAISVMSSIIASNSEKGSAVNAGVSSSAVVSSNSTNNENAKSNSSSDEDAKASSEEAKLETIKITAAQLLKEYDENGVKADENYKDKLIEVTGIVKNIDKDILDDIYITLDDGDKYSLISVQCYFSDKEKETVAEIEKGSEITVIGTCDGSLINIILKKCTIK